MRLSVIIIGDEILLGQVTDTNSGFIARTLGPDGWQMVSVVTVGDDASQIRAAIDSAMADSQLVITTGGLGPTRDDITKGVLLDVFGGELRHDEAVAANVERVFERRGLKMNELTMSQAMVPTSCKVIQNRYGTAPIMWFERDGRVLVSMPGVPFETEGMMRDEVADLIRRRFTSDVTLLHRSFMVTGLPESALAMHLAGFEDSLSSGLHLAYLPQPGLIRLRLDACGRDEAEVRGQFDDACKRLVEALGPLLIFDGDATAAEIAIDALRRRGYTMASAESCTGGNIAHEITMIPGSSEVFVGAVVAYSNDVKMRLLGVPADVLASEGAVSEPVVIAMAEGVRRATGADCGVATSGIAGPGGATPGKPVGTVWTAVSTPQGTAARLLHLPGNRARVIDRATREVLLDMVKVLNC